MAAGDAEIGRIMVRIGGNADQYTRTLDSAMANTRSAVRQIDAQTRQMSMYQSRLLQVAAASVQGVVAPVHSLKKAVNSLTLPLGVAGGVFSAFSWKALRMAMQVQESESLFVVSIGNMVDATREWSEVVGNHLRMNANDIRKNVGTMNVMLTSMGINEQLAVDMSKKLTVLAYDMASFYNIDPEEAFHKIQAGITGEAESLKRLGIIVNENTVNAFALKEGWMKSGKEMGEHAKIASRFGVIMNATKMAQGDLARTWDSGTNLGRSFGEQMRALTITIGQALIPTYSAYMKHAARAVEIVSNLVKIHPEATAQFVKYAAAIGMATGALSTFAFVGPFVLGPIVGIGKALLSMVLIGFGVVRAVVAMSLAFTGISAALGVANLGLGGFLVGLAGLLVVGYVVRAWVNALVKDFKGLVDDFWELVDVIKEGMGPALEWLGNLFNDIFSDISKKMEISTRQFAAFSEFAGALLSGEGWDAAVRASNKVMLGSKEDGNALFKEQWGLVGRQSRGDLDSQLQADFGMDVDGIVAKVQGGWDTVKEMGKQFAGDLAGTLKGAMNFDPFKGRSTDEVSTEDLIKRLGEMAQTGKAATDDVKADFENAAKGVDGLNESIEKTHDLMGAKVYKAGTLGNIVGDTSKKISKAITPATPVMPKAVMPSSLPTGVPTAMPASTPLTTPSMMSTGMPVAAPTETPTAMVPAGMDALATAAAEPEVAYQRGYANNTPGALGSYASRTPGARGGYWSRTRGGQKMNSPELLDHRAQQDSIKAGNVPQETMDYMSTLMGGVSPEYIGAMEDGKKGVMTPRMAEYAKSLMGGEKGAAEGKADGGQDAIFGRILNVLEQIAGNTRNTTATVGGY